MIKSELKLHEFDGAVSEQYDYQYDEIGRKGNTKNWKDITEGAKKTVATAVLIAALIFTVADGLPGDEEFTAAMVIEYISENYPEFIRIFGGKSRDDSENMSNSHCLHELKGEI